MHTFMSTFEHYVMIDIIDSNWSEFIKKLSKIQVFEDLIQLHNSFLDKVLDMTMLGRRETKIAEFIGQMLICIQKFAALVHDNQFQIIESGPMQDVEVLHDQFKDQQQFFMKFVEQLASKGHYQELNIRLQTIKQNNM